MGEQHAAALMEWLPDGPVASKADIEGWRAATKADIDHLREIMDARWEHTATKADLHDVRSEMHRGFTRQTWSLVTAFAVVMDPPERPVVRRANGNRPPVLPPTGGGDDDGRDREPRRSGLDNARLATMFFIAAEIMFFAGLISSYLVLRTGAAQWPPPLQPRLPVLVTGLNTIVLLASVHPLLILLPAFALPTVLSSTWRPGIERKVEERAAPSDRLARHRVHGFGMERTRPYGDAVVTGYGTVDGRKVFVFSQDFTVFGGSLGEMGSEKICKVMDLAMATGAPVIGINDPAGA